MSVDDILYSPIGQGWSEKAIRIIDQIIAQRDYGPRSTAYPLDRRRPPGALYLLEVVEDYYVHMRRWFWRIEITKISPFMFDGQIWEANEKMPYAAYGEYEYAGYRSIEDANLVPNTYTNYFIFRTEAEAKAGVNFLTVP